MDDVLSSFLTQLLLGLISVFVPVFTAWLGVKIKAAVADIKRRNGEDFEWALDSAVSVAVLAAEQAHLAGYIQDKKTYALGVVEKMLAERGVKIDLDVISAAIEAEVMKAFNKKKLASE